MTTRRAGVPLALREWRSVVLLAAAEEMLARLERELEPIGLSWRTCRVLALIARLQPVSQIAVAERLGIDRTTMSETARERRRRRCSGGSGLRTPAAWRAI